MTRAQAHLGLFMVAFAIRMIFVVFTHSETTSESTLGYGWSDEGADIATNLLDGRGYVASSGVCTNFRSFRMPVLPLLLWALWGAVGRDVLAAKCVMAIVSAANCLVISLLAERLFSSVAIGRVAGLMLAFLPSHAFWSTTLGPEALTSFLLSALVLSVLTSCSPSGHALSGVLASLLVQTRPVYFPYVLALGVWLTFRGVVDWRRVALPYFAAFTILLAPWVVRNAFAHGSLVILSTEGGITFAECNNRAVFRENDGEWMFGYAETQPDILEASQRLGELEFNRWLYLRGVRQILADPGGFLRSSVLRVGYLWRPVPRIFKGGYSLPHIIVMALTWSPVFVLAVFGFLACRGWQGAQHVPLLMALLWITLSAGLIRGSIRYRAPVEPFVVCYAAFGFSRLFARVGYQPDRHLA